jgi:hypothetical protein
MQESILTKLGIPADTAVLVLLVLVLVFLILMIFWLVKYTKLCRGYDLFMRGKDAASLEDTVSGLISRVENLEQLEKADKDVMRLFNRSLVNAYQKVAVIHYNAFEGMGGQSSFVLAMLDLNNNGFLLNVIHSRNTCYTYLKEIRDGQAEVVLGNEERMALMQAIKKKDRFFDPDEEILDNE